VYRLTPAGVFTVLYTFDNTHGATVCSADDSRVKTAIFYGTTKDGGTLRLRHGLQDDSPPAP